jgi:hypothetical protein
LSTCVHNITHLCGCIVEELHGAVFSEEGVRGALGDCDGRLEHRVVEPARDGREASEADGGGEHVGRVGSDRIREHAHQERVHVHVRLHGEQIKRRPGLVVNTF